MLFYGWFCVSINSHAQRVPYNISLEKEISNVKPTGLKEIGGTITYIPLETSKECLLGDISKGKIVVTDTHIAVWYWNQLVLFDASGNFISEIGRSGRGPGEYLGVWDYCFSLDGRTIYLLTYSDYRVLQYDVSGKFINSFKINGLNPVTILPLKDNLFVFHPTNQPIQWDPVQHSLIISDLQNNQQKTYPNYHKLTMEQSGFMMLGAAGASFYSYRGNIRFRELSADTLFTVTEKGLLPYAVFQLGKKLMPVEILVPANARRGDGTINEDRVLSAYEGKFFVTKIREDIDNLYFTLYDWRKYFFGYYNKQRNSVKVIGAEGFQNDIDGGLPFFPRYAYNDILVSLVDAFDLREHVLKSNATEMRRLYGQKYDDLVKLAKSLDDESNPVVVLVKK